MLNSTSIRLIVTVLCSVIVVLSSVNTFASGGDDSDDDNTEDSFDTSNFERAVVDPTYEAGKSVYNGRKKGTRKLSYCLMGLMDGEEAVALKRKTIKKYKKTSYSKLAASLVNCDNPSVTIINELERKDFLTVLYYLDKRYKLVLERS